MTIETVRSVLGWGAVINMGLMVWWFLLIFFTHDWIYKMHIRFYSITEEHFNSIHYAGMLMFKICIFMFFIVPYIALQIVG